MRLSIIRAFFNMESASGIVLLLATVLAIVLANSPLSILFEQILSSNYILPYFSSINFSLRDFVNDGLMTLFFLLIGLELKNEWAAGNLSFGKKIYLPAVAAIFGMLIPALIYTLASLKNIIAMRGWAIPMATDIAFSLGVLSLFKKKIPASLIFFLMLLAIFDDAGAVIVIALFFSAKIALPALATVCLIIGGFVLLAKYKINNVIYWCTGGVLLWCSLWWAGIHPVLAGIFLASALPAKGKFNTAKNWSNKLHPWVAYGIVPLFALVNAGVSLTSIPLDNPSVTHILIAITLGLCIGKPLGIVGSSALLFKLRFAKMPQRVNWGMFLGVAFLCGIGFTMSLFIGTLAFSNYNAVYLIAVKQSVLIASFISGILGAIILYFSCNSRRHY